MTEGVDSAAQGVRTILYRSASPENFHPVEAENINGVKVIRTFLIPRGNSSAIPLMLNYFSWAFFASIYAIYHSLFNKYDKIIVQQLSPVMMGIPAIIAKKITKTPVYFWVLDYHKTGNIFHSGVNQYPAVPTHLDFYLL